MNSQAEFELNGDYVIKSTGSYRIAGSVFVYERKGNTERLFCKGPTTAPIHAMVRTDYAGGD